MASSIKRVHTSGTALSLTLHPHSGAVPTAQLPQAGGECPTWDGHRRTAEHSHVLTNNESLHLNKCIFVYRSGNRSLSPILRARLPSALISASHCFLSTNLQLSQDNRKTSLQWIGKTNVSAFADILLELHFKTTY